MSIGDFTLLRPWWLLALLPLAGLLWRMARHPAGQGGWLSVVDAHLLPYLLLERSRYGRAGGLALLGAGLGLAVLALAGPAVPGAVDLAYRSDAARLMVLDLSAAMGPGQPPSARLERTRLKLLDLLRAVPQGQNGLVLYAEEPYLAAPLTTDVATIALLVPELSPEVMPLAGDRPERALLMAGDILARSGTQQRDLLWITASPAPPAAFAALAKARAAGVRVSVLHPDAVADAALRSAIEAGGGLYLAMQADGADVLALAKLLGSAKTRVAEARRNAATQRDVGPWLLLLLLPLAALVFRRGLLLMLLLPLLLIPPPAAAFDFEGLWQRADQRGWRLLQAGDADAAARLFADPRWRAVAHYRAGRYEQAAAVLTPLNDADAHYNRGNALARLGHLDQALAAYERALKLRPADADMRHNRDLMLQLLKQRQNPQSKAAEVPPSPPPQKQPQPGQGRAQDPTEPSTDAPPPAGKGSAEPPPPAAASTAAPQPAPASMQQEAVAGAPLTERDEVQREAGLLAEQWLRRMPSEQSGLLRRKLLLEHARRQAGEVEQPWRQKP